MVTDVQPPVDRTGTPLRLLLVHAHPDDETTTTGATAARYAAEGIATTLVTCTRGERGENALATERGADGGNDAADELGSIRAAELAKAAAELGIADVRFLGGPGTWWDSGMADARVPHPRAFSEGDLASQTAQLVAIIREVQPQVQVTYDERGGYGHPDHIRAHQVSLAAFDEAARSDMHPETGMPWAVSKLYAAVVPHSALMRVGEVMAQSGSPNPFLTENGDPLPLEAMPFGVPDEVVTARVDGRDWLSAKAAAMRAHRSQAEVNSWFFRLFEEPARGFGLEHFQLLRGAQGSASSGDIEGDLFAGLRQP